MNKKVTLKDIAIMQSGIYMKTDSQGEVRYLQVKDVNSENKLDYTQIATVINTGINKGGSNYCIQYEGTERSTIASSSFIIIRPVISNILPEFLCCFLNTSSILGMLKNAAVGTGIQVIPQSVMGEIQLDIPSIEVQRLVVEMDRLRKEGECIRSEIDILKQSLQDQLLMDSLK
jgi:restriction endonuclease S subunit